MIELLLVSVLGLAGAAVGTVVSGEDDEALPDDAQGAEEETDTDETGGDLLDFFPGDPASQDDAVAGSAAVHGTDADDTLSGDDASDTLHGAAGDDSLSGNGGDDALYGGEGGDTIAGDEGDDLLDGGAGDDRLTDWTGSNTMYGGDGDDILEGGFDADASSSLSGGDGNDTITDGDADAVIDGGAGDDTIRTGHGDATVDAGEGDDLVHTGIDTDIVFGGDGNDTLIATGTEAVGETDEVYGGSGDDILQLRGEVDAYGGDGADTFKAYANTWVDSAPVIHDYDPDQDRLEVELYSHEWRQDLEDFEVAVQDFEDGTGASVFVDGIEVMRVPGAAGLSVGDLTLTLV